MENTTRRKIFKRFKNAVKPKRFYEELAEWGILEEFLKTHLRELYTNDKIFREDMMEIFFRCSTEVIPDIEVFYLEQLCENLGFFLEYTRQWRTQRH